MISAWRIVKTKYVNSAFDGEGAKRYGGRWNSVGIPAVYASESLSLAALESFMHMSGMHLKLDFSAIKIQITKPLHTMDVSYAEYRKLLEKGRVRQFGDAWLLEGKSVILKVPSHVIPEENNIIINPLHKDFSKIIISPPIPFRYDPRMLKS